MTAAGPAPAGFASDPAANREQWFEPRSRRQAEAWGSTSPASPQPAGPSRPDGASLPAAAAPGGEYPPPEAVLRRDGPPWAEAEPQPQQQAESRRSASRRGQPRHGRHR